MLEQYSREEFLGYLILAAKELKLEEGEIEKLVSKTDECIDSYTEVYAEQAYDKHLGVI